MNAICEKFIDKWSFNSCNESICKPQSYCLPTRFELEEAKAIVNFRHIHPS